MDMLHFLYPFISWWALGCFHFLSIKNSAAINIQVQVFLWTYVLNALVCMQRNGYGNSMY